MADHPLRPPEDPTPSDASAVISWCRDSLPSVYATQIESMIIDAHRDDTVRGLLLTGSVARRDALPGTDIDVRYIVGSAVPDTFSREVSEGVLIERSVSTEEAARARLLNSPMHVYAYLDGIVLYDPAGVLASLYATAEEALRRFRTPPATKRSLAEALGHPEEKIRTALAAGDLLKATYSLSTASWQLIEGLWAANDLPLPPNASVRPHLKDLDGPVGVEDQFTRLFLGDTTARVEAGLFLLAWVRQHLTADGDRSSG